MTHSQLYMNTALLELLLKLPVFDMFSEAELRRMLYSGELLRLEKFAPGDTIIEEGTYGRWVYVLIKGAVQVLKQGVEICTLDQQGAIVGEIGALHGQLRSATVLARRASVFAAVNLGMIEGLSDKDGREYLERISEGLTPLIQQRLQQTAEIEATLAAIAQKRAELEYLERKLRKLGVSEDQSLLQQLLRGEA